MTDGQRADYSQALLTCSVNRRTIAACPLAFGEVGIKERVKSVLSYKKPAFWIIIVSIVAIIVASICLLTNPKTDGKSDSDNLPRVSNVSTFTIVDRERDEKIPCDQAFEEFYRNSNYAYEFSVIKSQYVEVHYKDGTKENIKDALKNGNVKISDLDRFGIKYTVKPLNEKDFSPIIDSIVFDIDKDGRDESCVLRYGPTSGVFTFILSVSENGKAEYFNIFHSKTFYNLSFEVQDGTLTLKGMTQEDNPKTEIYDFVVDGTNISLASDAQDISYWGEQGLNSPFAPMAYGEGFENDEVKPAEQEHFNAEVLAIGDGHIKVKCLAVTKGGVSEGAEVSVPKKTVSTKGIPPLKVGDVIRVVYSGVQETYPLQLHTVYAVYLVDDDGNIIP